MFHEEKINMLLVSRTLISTQQVPEKNSAGDKFHEQKSNWRGEKSKCNKFQKDKSGRNKLHEQ